MSYIRDKIIYDIVKNHDFYKEVHNGYQHKPVNRLS